MFPYLFVIWNLTFKLVSINWNQVQSWRFQMKAIRQADG